MAYYSEKNCKCIKEFVTFPDNVFSNEDELYFHVGREYQVDIYALYFKVYQNGGYNDYVNLDDSEFSEYFRLID